MSKTCKTPQVRSGYSYLTESTTPTWRRVSDEDWQIDNAGRYVQTGALYLGTRRIDGVKCHVWQVQDETGSRYLAQSVPS